MGRKAEDLTDRTFGMLRVIKQIGTKKYGNREWALWECVCKCGKTCEAVGYALKKGSKKSCGCLTSEDLKGKTFGRLKVLRNTGKKDKNGSFMWECECECGNICHVSTQGLNKEDTKSCGCLFTEKNKMNIHKAMAGRKLIDGTDIGLISRKSINSNNTSGVRGVCYRKDCQLYHAYITFKRKKHSLGYYKTVEEAARVRKIAENKIYGDFLDWYENEYKKEGSA